jgi:hypothetical protein
MAAPLWTLLEHPADGLEGAAIVHFGATTQAREMGRGREVMGYLRPDA